MSTHQVVIIGGGFGGLRAAQSLKDAPVQITLIDRRNFHLFQPLLYQVATGGLSPANIAVPIRGVLKRQKNARVFLGEVTDIDVVNKRVVFGGTSIYHDTLIVATGSHHYYFGHDEWERLAPALKTIEDATEIRRRVLSAFEAAELESDRESARSLLTFVIVGGRPTGHELAGALGEVAHDTLKNDFRRIDPRDARIILLEGSDRVLPSYPGDLSAKAAESLAQLGVTVRTRSTVADVQDTSVTISSENVSEQISTRTVLWAAGVQASELGKVLARSTGTELDKAGRVMVRPDLSVPGHGDILVIGDLAHFVDQTGKLLPGIAPVAMQQCRYVGKLIQQRLQGKELPRFVYRDHGNMATIGRAAAVTDFGRFKFHGFLAWFVWLFVHLLYLVEFDNHVLVLVQWAWNYFTRNRAARLITGERHEN